MSNKTDRITRTDKTSYGRWNDNIKELNPLIAKWLNEQKARNVRESSLLGYKKTLVRLDKFCSVDKITKDDLVNYLGNMNTKTKIPRPVSDSTIFNHSIMIKMFFKSIGKPELVEWLEIKKPSEQLKADDILTTEEINAMLEAANSEYWKALISFLFDSGARISEAMSLRWRDLTFTVDGIKTSIPNIKIRAASRPVILPVCMNYMKNLKTFSGGKPDDIIFNKDYRFMARHIHKIKERAAVACPSLTYKKVGFHMFRHASATESVRRNIRISTLKHKYGWSEKSNVYNRYVHLSETDHLEEIMRIAGKEGTSRVPLTNIKEDELVSITTTADLVFELERKMAEKDSELALIRERQDQIRITEEDHEKQLAGFAERLQADHNLRFDDDFVASMAAYSLTGSKMTFQKEEEVVQEKSYEQRFKDLEKKMELLMKEKMANV